MLVSDSLPIMKDLPSPEHKWELVEVIGEGNYGEVFKAHSLQTGELAAVKVMEAVLDKEEDIKAELNVFQNHAHHPNIVNFFGAFVKKDPIADDQLWIVMEYCTGGSVTDLVRKMREKGENMAEDVMSYILREVLAGLAYLHGARVLHRDVKGQNVLLTSDARVKLIDFGISAVVDRSLGRRATTIGTPYWMAPEVIICEQQMDSDYDARADIWSLGITAIEIADSTPPLFGENPMRALFRIPRNKPPTVQHPSKWSRRFNDFIAKCLIKDFEKRPTSQELLSHQFVRFVPKDPKVLRRKLVGLLDIYQHEDPEDPFSETSSSASGADTTKRNLKILKTLEVVDDLATLEFIDESVIVSHLMKRYKKRLIYTYVGDILVSINPFQKLDIYNERYSEMYWKPPWTRFPPHIFAVAGSAYQAMVREGRDQCCVVSGESGAGKTEASNLLVQQFMRLGRAETRSLEEKILQVNPLMESFGNARTVINNNSSRFGKYLELHFTTSGHIVGARLSEYLLEKSRVVSQARRERNFHIFYYLLAGLQRRQQLKKYNLRPAHHRYLEQRGTGVGSAKRNAIFSERFDEIERAFHLFGFSTKEFESVCSILAAILNIGDVRLETDFLVQTHLGEVSAISNRSLLSDVAQLLQVDPVQFEQSLITSQVVTHGETIVRPNTVEQALDSRDGMAKALYGRLFSWIVNKINPTLHPSSRAKNVINIGILDIFGFENFRTNSFEQLLINVANEQLQFYFNQHVFAWEQDEYEREGVDASQVTYQDNRPLLELLLNRPMGMLALLDEESKFPRATDLSLAMKFHENFQASPYYKKPKDRGPVFSVLHYAGVVAYETIGFLEKNRDTLKPEVTGLLQRSGNKIVRSLFYTPLSRTGSLLEKPSAGRRVPPSATPLFSRRAPMVGRREQLPSSRQVTGRTPLSSSETLTAQRSQTVSTYFTNSLRELMAKLLRGTPHFVRCIRPNELKSPDHFQPEKVYVQLRYTGILETTRIRKEGFSHRILFEDFIPRYKVISYPLSKTVAATPTNCVQILMQAGLKNWVMGKSKVFLKYYHIDRLHQILNNYDQWAIKVQRVVRGWLGRRKAAVLWLERRDKAAVRIQAASRGFLTRLKYRKTLQRREQAALTIQTVVRMWLCRRWWLSWKQRRLSAIVLIQRVVRGWLARKRFELLKEENRRRQAVIHVRRLRDRLQQEALASAREMEKRIQQQSRMEESEGDRQKEEEGRQEEEGSPADNWERNAVIIQRAFRSTLARRRLRQREKYSGQRGIPPQYIEQVSYSQDPPRPSHHSPRQPTSSKHLKASPKDQGRQLQRQAMRHGGDRLLLRPAVAVYYERMQGQHSRTPPTQPPHKVSRHVNRPASAPSHSHGRGPGQTEQARRVFEDLIARQSRAARRDSPLVYRQHKLMASPRSPPTAGAFGRVHALTRRHSPSRPALSRSPPQHQHPRIHTRHSPRFASPGVQAVTDSPLLTTSHLRGSPQPRARDHSTHQAELGKLPQSHFVHGPKSPREQRNERNGDGSKKAVLVTEHRSQGNQLRTRQHVHVAHDQRPRVREKRRPRLRADSVFQKLLERFDPMRLANTGKV